MVIDEQVVLGRIRRHILPLLMLCYFAAYLDRVNLSFAALSMNADLGLSASVFGAGAGIFFLGYVLFEVPSNMAMQRFGARRWFARIMLSWGVISLLFAFVRTTPQFLGLRFLLGVAEAGFYPGVMLFLTRWFPSASRARMIGAFAVALPASAAIGAPVSGFILNLHGFLGLRGWQWLFILEALPSLVLGFVLLRKLVDSPREAHWLAADERAWLERTLAAERHALPPSSAHGAAGAWGALRNPLVWLLGFIYCGIVAANYGVSFFLPQIVRAFGVSLTAVGLLSSLPFVAGALGLLWWGARSDKRRERRWHLLVPGIVAVLALIVAAATDYPPLRFGALVCAGFGAFANLPVFWTLPASMLPESEAPAGIAVVSSIGNVAGFAAPYAVGALKDMTGTFASGMAALAVFIAVTVVVAARVVNRRSGVAQGLVAPDAGA
ncbi:MFS transporter [Paraburkholderia unamae]|uniref:Sugar phosphate permease n=1 Tax=Paraburkholderia unamae TaxID=219649 RepID=A0ABX5KI43_9BURK|nr:MFS transporter [Paraburkholderia unamae]PVX75728.1 sugar phosphate permease [Paraburkholderia unamae]